MLLSFANDTLINGTHKHWVIWFIATFQIINQIYLYTSPRLVDQIRESGDGSVQPLGGDKTHRKSKATHTDPSALSPNAHPFKVQLLCLFKPFHTKNPLNNDIIA